MNYCRVCAIDAGTRNFAWCIVDNLEWRNPQHWHREDLWAPAPGKRAKPTIVDIIAITVAWCERNDHLLRECDHVVLEQQMRKPYLVMNAVIHSRYYNSCIQVHPMTVGTWWGLPHGREAKKAAGLDTCRANVVSCTGEGKQDDKADAWLMAVYQMVKSNALSRRDLHFL